MTFYIPHKIELSKIMCQIVIRITEELILIIRDLAIHVPNEDINK